VDDLLLFGNYIINLDQHLISLEPILPSNTDGPISQLLLGPGCVTRIIRMMFMQQAFTNRSE